jgi:hypothetical protein
MGFFDMLKRLTKKLLMIKTDESFKWLYNKLGKKRKQFDQDFKKVRKIQAGSMIHFIYYPKYEKQLPYWDALPLVIPYANSGKSFIGLNMHYLPPKYRAAVFDVLIKLKKKNSKYLPIDGSIRMLLSDRVFRQCVKRYLYSFLKSEIVEIALEDWEKVLFLPTHEFQKASASVVWSHL